jgi:hypothetical protein
VAICLQAHVLPSKFQLVQEFEILERALRYAGTQVTWYATFALS